MAKVIALDTLPTGPLNYERCLTIHLSITFCEMVSNREGRSMKGALELSLSFIENTLTKYQTEQERSSHTE